MKNWRIILSFLLSSLILFNTLRASLTYIYYAIDTEGFIEFFCENIDKPELECNGKCQLKKVIETDTNNTNKPKHLIDLKEVLLYKESLLVFDFNSYVSKQKQFFFYNELYNYKTSFSFFHPPQV